MGLLDGGLKAVFGKAFAPIFIGGAIYVPELTRDLGDDITPVWGDGVPCKLAILECNQTMRQAPNYTIEDVRIIILQSGVDLTLTTDCHVLARGTRYKLNSPLTQDPAQATWEARGTPIQPVPT